MIALLTDFGLQDTYVGAMKSVISGIAPKAQIIDLTHAIPPGDVRAAAFELWRAAPILPPGTILVAVVDPGVGSARPAVAVEFKDFVAIGPDNGIFSYLLFDHLPLRVIRLENEAFQRTAPSMTFHGRDIFAPVGAHLASGVALEALGPAASDLLRLSPPLLKHHPAGTIEGEILHIDRFGNLVTSIGRIIETPDGKHLQRWTQPGREASPLGEPLQLEIPGGLTLPIQRTFTDVPSGQPLAYTGSSGLLEIGVRDGNAAAEFRLDLGDRISLSNL
jgi:S-adenosylmethionine hydrolase